jgi:methylmalonyl-CoA decarboxylase
MGLILIDYHDRIGTITFNNMEKRNCLSNDLLNELVGAVAEMKNFKARAVIIRAEKGAKVWSSGRAIDELPDPGRDPLSYDDPLEHALRRIQHFPAPVIAMIEGSVWGGACDLACTCDLAIGSPTASFSMTPAKIGVPYNSTGILHFINIVGMRMAREMFFTAQPVNAERAHAIGILNHLMPVEDVESFTYNMANQIAENSPLSIRVIKEQLRILGNSHPLSPDTFERIQGLRRQAYESDDYKEGKTAFLEKRKPVFRGE